MSASDGQCLIPADSDILGLGVRLGLYFQVFSSVFLAFVHPQEWIATLPVSNILFTGIFIAVVRDRVQNNVPPSVLLCMLDLFSFDIWMIFPILVAGLDSNVKVSFWSTSLAGVRWLGILLFKLWFWFRGLYIPNDAQCMEPRVFFYANVGAYGGIRIFFRFFLVLLTIASSFGVCYWIYEAFKRLRAIFRRRGESESLRAEGNMDVGEYAGLLVLYGASAMVFSLLASELQLKWNNLDGIAGVDSTGQILSLIIGCFTLFRSVVLFIKKCGRGESEQRQLTSAEREAVELRRKLVEKEKTIKTLQTELKGKETSVVDLEKGGMGVSEPEEIDKVVEGDSSNEGQKVE
jgi:hypothetical protein